MYVCMYVVCIQTQNNTRPVIDGATCFTFTTLLPGASTTQCTVQVTAAAYHTVIAQGNKLREQVSLMFHCDLHVCDCCCESCIYKRIYFEQTIL